MRTGPRKRARVAMAFAVRPGAIAALFAVPLAFAQEEPAVRLPEVSVTATRAERENFDLPASIDTVGRRIIGEGNPQVDLSEALNRVPGIVVQNRQNYAQDLQVSSRGFGARTSFGVRGMRLIADGIPATMPDGQGQAATFNLSSAQRIEVLRGPFSSLYGNASGGVIQVFTADGPKEPTATGQVSAGSNGMWKAGAQLGGTQGPFNYILDASRFETDGVRSHSAARRDHVNGKLRVDTGALGTLTFVVNALDQPSTQDPLGLTAAQVAQDPRQPGANALAFDTRKNVNQTQLGVTWDYALSPTDKLHARAYGGDRQVTQYLSIPLAAQAPPTSSGGLVDLDRGFGGAGLRWTRTLGLEHGPATLSLGVDYDRMAERRQGFVNDLGIAGALKRDEDDIVANRDVYAQADWQLAPRWTVMGGVRHSRVRFETRDYFVATANPDDSGSVGFTRTTPVLGAVFMADPALNVYANYGKGFETPTFAELAYRPGGATGLNFALKPSKSTHGEVGVKARFGAAGKLNAALFRVDVEDEIVVNSASGGRSTFVNAARTRREGLELAWQNRFGRHVEAAVSYTLIDARFDRPFASGTPAVTVPAGNRIPGVPRSTLYAELVWRHAASGFHAGVEVKRSDKVFVNDANSEAAAGYTVWNLRAGLEQRSGKWRLKEFLRVDNVSDRDYIGSVIVADSNGRFYEPAPGRRIVAGVEASLGF